jgi:hypothetical protein
MEAVKRFQHRLKHDGLRSGAADASRPEAASSNPALQVLHTQMQAYLKRESAGIGEGEIWLASSDVLESLFGKSLYRTKINLLKIKIKNCNCFESFRFSRFMLS